MIDFHCHLDLFPNPASTIAKADEAGIYVLSVTTTPSAWIGTARMARGRSRIRTALGIHPQVAHERLSELSLFEELGHRTRFFGEIGLDGSLGYRHHSDKQSRAFNHALAIARRQGGKILTIHSRSAVNPVLDALEAHPGCGAPILHWFTGSEEELSRAVELGCWFSVGPAMLKSKRGRRLTSLMPRDRIVTETDGPFAKVNSRQLEPTDSWLAVEQLASVWQTDTQTTVEKLKSNLRGLLQRVPDRSR